MSIKELSPASQLADYYFCKSERYLRASLNMEKDESLDAEKRAKHVAAARSLAKKYHHRAKMVLL